MAFKFWPIAAALGLGAVAAWSQQATPPIVQPGAPGQMGKILQPSSVAAPPRGPSTPDIEFMQGMIMHHGQAVEMTDMMATRTHNKELLALGKRISISQTDEMKSMKQWLEERDLPTTMKMDHSKMDHSKGVMQMMMPGMLTPQQMQALGKAKGAAFDHLFLTGMIQHHGGALTMVKDLFDTPGAGQDSVLFDFVTDVDNTQRAEINIMQGMLAKEKH